MKYIALKCGCCTYFVRWLSDDFQEAYDTWDDAPQFIQFLLGLGIPPQDLTAILPEGQWKDELHWCNEMCVYNAFAILSRSIPDIIMLALLKQRYPLETLVPRLLSVL